MKWSHMSSSTRARALRRVLKITLAADSASLRDSVLGKLDSYECGPSRFWCFGKAPAFLFFVIWRRSFHDRVQNKVRSKTA